MISLFVYVFVCTLCLVKSQTQKEITNNPHDFHLFENFDMTAILYNNETKIIEKLKELQKNLVSQRKNMHVLKQLINCKSFSRKTWIF